LEYAWRPRKPRQTGRAIEFLQRMLSLVATVLVAVATLGPGRTEQQIPILAQRQELRPEFDNVLTLIITGLLAVAVISVVWKTRLAKRLRVSWPLLLVGVLYLVGFATLVSSMFRGALLNPVSGGAGEWLRKATAELNAEHAVTYVAFMIIVAVAWREKIALWWMALGLFIYGYILELLQEFVPGRDYSLDDLAANALGIVIGLAGILLFDLLTDRKAASSAQLPERRRAGHVSRSSHVASRSSRGSKRVRLIASLIGLFIALASVFAGSVVEFRFAQVLWQIFTQFSAPYVFSFWLGVLVMVGGWLWMRNSSSSRRVRTAPTLRR
jgi:hypothetical protein